MSDISGGGGVLATKLDLGLPRPGVDLVSLANKRSSFSVGLP